MHTFTFDTIAQMFSRFIKQNRRFFIFIVLGFSILVYIHIAVSLYTIITTSAPDFSVFYTAAEAFVNERNPYREPGLYTGVGYPPFTLIMFSPFVLFPYQIAQELFVLLSALCVVVSVYISLKIIDWNLKYYSILLLSSFAFLMFPTKFTLGMGQSNSIVLALLLVSLFFLLKNNKKLSGIVFGLALVLKPITVFMVIYFLITKNWKALMYSLLTVLSIFMISLYFIDLSLYRYYLQTILPDLFNLSNREIYYNQGLIGFIARIFSDNNLRFILNMLLSFTLLGLTCTIIFLRRRHGMAFGLILITLIMIDTLSWQHHFIWLIFPYILILKEVIHNKSLTQLIVLISSYILVSLNVKNPYEYTSVVILSHAFIGILYLYVLYCLLYFKPDKLNRA